MSISVPKVEVLTLSIVPALKDLKSVSNFHFSTWTIFSINSAKENREHVETLFCFFFFF